MSVNKNSLAAFLFLTIGISLVKELDLIAIMPELTSADFLLRRTGFFLFYDAVYGVLVLSKNPSIA